MALTMPLPSRSPYSPKLSAETVCCTLFSGSIAPQVASMHSAISPARRRRLLCETFIFNFPLFQAYFREAACFHRCSLHKATECVYNNIFFKLWQCNFMIILYAIVSTYNKTCTKQSNALCR